MNLSVGNYVWLPCDVKPGPFSDERIIRMTSQFGNWMGFVPASTLKDPIPQGSTLVTALVVDIQNERLSAKLPGEALLNTLFEDLVSRAQPLDSLKS